MTSISRAMALAWILVGLAEFLSPPALADDGYRIADVELIGVKRTNKHWLVEYLGLKLPQVVSDAQLGTFARKLLTTAVFTNVTITVRPTSETSPDHIMVIVLDEKWTTIPVVRGAYGGGTPLTVLGVYDTHSFGKLWTLGAESRKYGDAPAGFVTWARAPRWLEGNHVLGIELWQEFRVRSIYDKNDTELGTFNTDTKRIRALFAHPLPISNWQAGLDLKTSFDAPTTFAPAEDATITAAPSSIALSNVKEQQVSPMARLVYDDINIDNLDHDGWRFIASAGPQFSSKRGNSARAEAELFNYQLMGNNFNLAAHALVGQSTDTALASQYFLGGLDSIRGIPDGAVYGARAAYANIELRHLTQRWRYCWLQTVAFVDAGGAASEWRKVGAQARSSAGVGLRIAIPQIYRLIFRIDYAWSLDGSGSQGFAAGLNELFQPYPPL